MAYVKSIWVHDSSRESTIMNVTVLLKPSGEVSLKVPLPPKFFAALLAVAQTAADAHEAQMRAEILGDMTEDTPL